MIIDGALLWSISEKLGILVAGAIVARLFERRPRLIAYYGHVGEFRLEDKSNPGKFSGVHTHSIVIRNSGKVTANNVRVPHNPIPDNVLVPHISVNHDAAYKTESLPGGGNQLVFATLVPREQVTISYLYFPPLTFNLINGPVRSDEGMAKVITVLPQEQYPKWVQLLSALLLLVGAITLLYVGVEFAKWAYSRW